MKVVRDTRVPRPQTPRPPEVGVVRALIPPQPGVLDGMTYEQVRIRLGGAALGASDGTLEQALLDDGLEVE